MFVICLEIAHLYLCYKGNQALYVKGLKVNPHIILAL